MPNTKFMRARAREGGIGTPLQWYIWNAAAADTTSVLGATAAPGNPTPNPDDYQTTTITTGLTDPDVPRSIVVDVSTDTGDPLVMRATIGGTDWWGNVISETLTNVTTTQVETNLAFRTVSHVVVTTLSGFTAGDQFTVGYGNKLGLPVRMGSADDLLVIQRGDIDTTVVQWQAFTAAPDVLIGGDNGSGVYNKMQGPVKGHAVLSFNNAADDPDGAIDYYMEILSTYGV